jgi:hypothetical protein
MSASNKFIIDDTGHKNANAPYAIFHLCYLNDLYIMGLLDTLSAHRKVKPSNVELVVMVDKYISNYKPEILQLADRVITIDLQKLENHSSIYGIKKYAMEWINYIHNKWQCLYFDEYKKILFLDIDTLPVSPLLYNVFTNYTEDVIFSGRTVSPKNCWTTVYYDQHRFHKYKSYDEYNKDIKIHVDASYMLLPPSKKLHADYFQFMSTVDPTDPSIITSGVGSTTIDEKSLLYYITCRTDLTCNLFRPEDDYAVPWVKSYVCDTEKDVIRKSNSLHIFNYRSQIKPFLMPIEFLYPESYIWKLLETRIVSGNKIIKALSIRNALYSYLLSEKESYLKPTFPEAKKHISDILDIIHKNKLTLSDPLFDPMKSYTHIIESFDLLFSYIEHLNKNYEKYDDCCGLIDRSIMDNLLK